MPSRFAFLAISSALVSAGATLSSSPTPPREVSVQLKWVEQGVERAAPPDGALWLVRAGGKVLELSPRPTLRLPPDRYELLSWGPDWVVVRPREVDLAAGTGQNEKLTLELHFVRGCPVEAGSLRSVEAGELELVSAVGWSFRVSLPPPYPLTVPEGEGVVLLYSKGSVSRWFPYRCKGTEALRFEAPPPLPPGTGRVLLLAQAPAGQKLGSLQFAARETRRSDRELPRVPSGMALLGARALAWFEALPVGPYEFTAAGAQIRTVDQRLELRAGSSPVASFELRPRIAVEVPLEFQARPPHRSGALQLLRCSSRPVSPARLPELSAAGRCQDSRDQQQLKAGKHTYTFSGLDRGLYGVYLTYGDQVLSVDPWHLPEWIFAVHENDPEIVHLKAVTLVELEIQGTVRREGVPVAGTLQFDSWAVGKKAGGKAFRVDDQGRFRASLLGRLWPRELLEAHLARRLGPLPELARLASELEQAPVAFWPTVVWLHAVKDRSITPLEGKFLFAGHSTWTIDLPAEAKVQLVPVDQASGAPVVPFLFAMRSQPVRLWYRDRALVDGSVWGGALMQQHSAPVTLTIPAGKEFSALFSIVAEGYQQKDFTLAPTPAGIERVAQVSLEREAIEEEPSAATQLLGPGGEPLARARVLWWDPREGRIHFSCSEEANEKGRLLLNCPEPRERGFLIHSKVPILPVEARELERSVWKYEEVVAPRTLALVDSGGLPIPDAEVQLAFEGDSIDPIFFWMLRTVTGAPLPLPDEEGRLELPPLRPGDPWKLLLRRPGETEWFEVDLRKHAGSELVIP